LKEGGVRVRTVARQQKGKFMNLRGKIVSVLGAAVLTVGLAAPAMAQSGGQTRTADIDVRIGTAEDGGTLTFSFIQNIPFEDVPFSNNDQTVNGGMTVSVQDTRGLSQGWQLSISGTDFTSATSDDVIPVGNFSLDVGAVTVVSGRAEPLPTATDFVMGTGPTVMLNAPANSGNGRYSVPVTGTLVIPGGTDIGLYSSTLTGTLTSAP
jgi:hypothetical protein